MRIVMVLGVVLINLAGCINISTHIQPVNDKVRPVLLGEDCTPIVGGLGWGTNTIEKAMQQASPSQNYDPYRGTHTIRTIRSVALTESAMLLLGQRCIEVTGEP